jgi:hypothetical protein
LLLAPAYKKMAGTSAVFLSADFDKASPVERDGLIWSAAELHLEQFPSQHQRKPAMSTVLALEGLEEYDLPADGDLRQVESVGADFVYFSLIHGWIQITQQTHLGKSA